MTWPSFTPGEAVTQAYDEFLAQVEEHVDADVREKFRQVRAKLDFSSDPGLLGRGLADVLEVLKLAADVAIDVLFALNEAAFALLKNLVEAALDFMKATIEIPFISAFYRWLTGENLSLLGLFSLMIAVPAAFALKLMGREPAYASKVSPARPSSTTGAAPSADALSLGQVQIIAGSAQIVWAAVNGVLAGADLTRSIKLIGVFPIGTQPLPTFRRPGLPPACLRWCW